MMYTSPTPDAKFNSEWLARRSFSLNPLPPDLDKVIDEAWTATKAVPGFLGENEARFLGLLAALVPAKGMIVEIGSFKGRSTVMLAKVAAHYGLGSVVAIDPHTRILSPVRQNDGASTYDDFLASLRGAGVEKHVEVHRAFSKDIQRTWERPIRFLWIDGDHSYEGARQDFAGFLPFVNALGVVALHDALNNFPGPVRVFEEEMLRPQKFGPAGFVHSIAWAQLRPQDAANFAGQREKLARRVAPLIPITQQHPELRGWSKIRYKLIRSRVPRSPISAAELARLLA
jgi:predicted O-methyltransferase YrrM